MPAPAGGRTGGRAAAGGGGQTSRRTGRLLGWGRGCAWLCADRLLPGTRGFQAAGWGRGRLALSFSGDVSLGLLVSSSYCLLSSAARHPRCLGPAWPSSGPAKTLLCLPISGPPLAPISASPKDHLPDVCLLVCLSAAGSWDSLPCQDHRLCRAPPPPPPPGSLHGAPAALSPWCCPSTGVSAGFCRNMWDSDLLGTLSYPTKDVA